MTANTYLAETHMLDFTAETIQRLCATRGWRDLLKSERIGAAYDFVRDEIAFAYNSSDTLRATQVLADGFGQCNTKATLLMAILRALDIPCRLHGFTIHKSLQRGVVPEATYWLAPESILHSWVELQLEDKWINLEGFILDDDVLTSLQRAFPERNSLCAYAVGTDCLQTPAVQWTGSDTYIQRTGINRDLGVYDSPDEFYASHQQALTGVRGLLYRNVVRYWMNRRVEAIRKGRVPKIPGGEKALTPQGDWTTRWQGQSRHFPLS